MKRIALIYLCINRNILECKDQIRLNDNADDEVLIETYWNVKQGIKNVSS